MIENIREAAADDVYVFQVVQLLPASAVACLDERFVQIFPAIRCGVVNVEDNEVLLFSGPVPSFVTDPSLRTLLRETRHGRTNGAPCRRLVLTVRPPSPSTRTAQLYRRHPL